MARQNDCLLSLSLEAAETLWSAYDQKKGQKRIAENLL